MFDMIFCDYSNKDGVKNKEVQEQCSRSMYVIHYIPEENKFEIHLHIYMYIHTYTYMNLDLL